MKSGGDLFLGDGSLRTPSTYATPAYTDGSRLGALKRRLRSSHSL